MKKEVFVTHSPEQTINLAKSLAQKLKGGEIIIMSGNLGTGKTTFLKGLALGLGIKEEITSPTFTLLHLHRVKKRKIKYFLHLDAYRLRHPEEIYDLALDEWLGKKNFVLAIEWGEKLEKFFRNLPLLKIKFSHLGLKKRKISIQKF